MSLGAGERIGPYEVVAPMGAGLMGEVYRARDPRLGREVAIKMMTGPYRDDPERLSRLREEARVAGALDHPNVLVVHDVGDRDGVPYLVCELLEGNTLRARLAEGALDRTLALNVAVQIARGLSAIHQAGAVHGDLRPANLMLLASGRVKILDFGVARTANAAAGDGTATRTGAVSATAAYMAPEQLRGATIDPRTDLFSFGVILHEMLSGARPFSGASDVELGHAILEEDPPRLPDTSIDSIARRCMAKDPADRYQSAHDLAFALEALLAGTRAPFVRRPWRTRATAITAILAAIAGGAVLGRSRRSAPPRRPPRPQTSIGPVRPFAAYPLTNRRGLVRSARFLGRTTGSGIVYSASWDGGPPAVYATDVGTPGGRELVANAELLSASPADGTIAVLLRPKTLLLGDGRVSVSVGTLAMIPEGGNPEPIADDVVSADWSHEEDSRAVPMAVTRVRGDRGYVEWPLGNVVYQGSGAQTSLRVSPDGRFIAFIAFDDVDRKRVREPGQEPLGELLVMDRDRNLIRAGLSSLRGLAWSGDEILASAHGNVYRYRPGGKRQPHIDDVRPLFVQDVGLMGRVLVIADDTESTLRIKQPGTDRERTVWSRPPDPYQSWDDMPDSFASPDGMWVITTRREQPGDPRPAFHYVLEPKGPGARRDLMPFDGVTEIGHFTAWSVDSTHAYFECFTPKGATCAFDRDGRGAIAVPGMLPRGWVSPDGRWILATPYGGKAVVVAATDGSGTTLPMKLPDDVVLHESVFRPGRSMVGWTADSSGLLIWGGARSGSAHLERIDAVTGAVTPWRSLGPTDLAGDLLVSEVTVRRGEEDYQYSLTQTVAALYLMEPVPR